MPFISFIIPVYNVEEYLEQCVDSVLNQDYSDIEIILVDDGSTDNSGRMCDKYAENYSNIKVIHQKNQGLSAARNVGIDNASGEYIVFLDSDDFWRPNVLGSLVKRLHDGDPDILVFNISSFDNINQTYGKFHKRNTDFDFNSNALSGEEFLLKALGQAPIYGWIPVRYIIKRTHLNAFNLRFKFGIKFEDMELTYQILLKARQVLITDVDVYVYRINREGSITNANTIKLQTLMDELDVTAMNIKNTKRLNISKELKRKLCNNFAYTYFETCHAYHFLRGKSERKILYAKMQKAQWILKYSSRFKAKIIKRFGLGVYIFLSKTRHDIVLIIKPTVIGKIYLSIRDLRFRVVKLLKHADTRFTEIISLMNYLES